MLASEQTISELALPALDGAKLTLPALDLRAVARRLAIPAALAGGAVVAVVLAGGKVHAFADAVGRVLGVNPGWAILGIAFECVSLIGYAALLSLVAGNATDRIGARESAQITLAGAAATRLLPTAGAGGAALTLWSLRRAGLSSRVATRTLLAFLVVLYSVFLIAIVLAGTALAAGLARSSEPLALGAVPAGLALLAIAIAPRLLGAAVADACQLVRSANPRLIGAIVYWGFDAAVLWATLHAFGTPTALPVIALAYFVGQVANTLPIPGAVSGGIAGVLIAFGVPAGLALPSVLAYRAIAVWLPTPAALAAVPGLRNTVCRWAREDAANDAVA